MSERIDQKTSAVSVLKTDLFVIAKPTTGEMFKATVGQVIGNTEVSLVDAATINWDYSQGNIARVVIAGNRTINVTNVDNGAIGILKLKQDATGGRVPVLSGNLETGLAFSVNPNDEDILAFTYIQGVFYWCISNFGTTTTGGGGTDVDADAYISAAGITNVAHKNAITSFVTGLKTAGLWATKMRAFWPLYGTTYNAAKFNLKNPVDTDGGYRLSQTGTITYSNGALVTSTTAMDGLNTHLQANDSGISQNDCCIVASVKTNVNELRAVIGTANTGSANANYIVPNNGGSIWAGNMSNGADTSQSSGGSSLGRFYTTRVGATQFSIYKNGTLVGTVSNTSSTPNSDPFIIGAGGNATLAPCTARISMAGIFKGLTGSEISTLDGLISTFETAIGH